MDLDAYFRRIGWSGPRDPTLDVLAGLCLHHTTHVTFENLDVLMGQPIRLDLPSLEAKLVGRRRGGYCFEQNGLFQAMLTALGFRVTALGARVRLGVSPDVHTPRTHMLLRVDLDEGPHVADVGFGFTPTGPLRLEAGLEQRLHLATYRFARDGDRWTLELRQPEGFAPAYVFTEEPWLPIDYEVANHYTSTHPRSHFVLGPLVMRRDVEGGAFHILRGKELSVRRGAAVETRTLAGSEEAVKVLRSVFGLEIPEGTRLRGVE